MMKKILIFSIVLLLASKVSALALFYTDVGGYDQFKAASAANMSGPQEEAWIADQYGFSVADIEYTKWDASDLQWTNVDDISGTTYDSAIYFDFRTEEEPDSADSEGTLPDEDPFAFLVKAASGDSIIFNDGSSGDVAGSSFLFTNLNLTQYGVIDLDWFTRTTGNSSFSIETISHTSIGYGGGDIPTQGVIPEPSTLILLGAGLIGLAVYRRKKH